MVRVPAVRLMSLCWLVVFMLPLGWGQATGAQGEEFFKGKTLRIIIGTGTGGGVDLYTRVIAQHLPKHLPGQPNIIVQNMPGASSLVAANYVYNIAKPDGLTLGALQAGVYFSQILGRDNVKFDWSKFTWIGTPHTLEAQLYMRSDTPYKTLEDIRNAAEPPRCGGAGTGATGYYVPKIIEETLGLKFQHVTGYKSGAEIDLAVERGELHCRAFDIGSFLGREPTRSWYKNGFVHSLIQTGQTRDERLPNVPTLYELMDKQKTPEPARRMAKAVLSAGRFGRPMVAPPRVSPEITRIIREAYASTMKDPEFVAETKKRRYDLEPVSGEEMDKMADEVINQPPDVVQRVKKLLAN